MIEATGVLSLVADARHGHVAVPDVVSPWGEPADGLLYRNLIDLLGKDVYVLVLPKDELLAMCTCGHTRADHLEFENWQSDNLSSIEPSIEERSSHLSYAGYYRADDVYCKCKGFEVVHT